MQSESDQLAELKRWQANVEEREAAVCPEDVPFDEYIRFLWDALRPFAAVYQENADLNEAVLVRGEKWVLNRDLERAAKAVPQQESGGDE